MTTSEPITIRPAFGDDAVAIRRLAALDSAPIPPQPLLLAEVDDEPRAAISLLTGAVIADPFELTDELVALLRLHAAQRTARAQSPALTPSGARAARRPRLRSPA